MVLIEDCEVFLEERQMADVQRNAVVSVVLEAIRGFKGILILETSRGMPSPAGSPAMDFCLD